MLWPRRLPLAGPGESLFRDTTFEHKFLYIFSKPFLFDAVFMPSESHINCNTKKVLYYLKCNMCNGASTYTGLTKTKLRARTNNHITCCRKGTGSDIIDRHVFKCGTKNKCLNGPFFKMYAFMVVSTEEKLLTYERYLHRGATRHYEQLTTRVQHS